MLKTLLATAWLLLAVASPGTAQETFGRIVSSGDRATLTVFDSRPLEQAAQTLGNEFGLRIAAEDPLYLWEGDLTDIGRASSGLRIVVPKPLLIEIAFDLAADGRPADVPGLIAALIAEVGVHRPFGYTVDVGPAGYTIVPTQMRNERGVLVPFVSPLDTAVTLPRTTLPLAVHADAITEAMKASTALEVACCTYIASNFDLQTQVDLRVDHESARHALQRLMLLRPEPLVQHMRCQALTRTCLVQWTPVRQARPMQIPH